MRLENNTYLPSIFGQSWCCIPLTCIHSHYALSLEAISLNGSVGHAPFHWGDPLQVERTWLFSNSQPVKDFHGTLVGSYFWSLHNSLWCICFTSESDFFKKKFWSINHSFNWTHCFTFEKVTSLTACIASQGNGDVWVWWMSFVFT